MDNIDVSIVVISYNTCDMTLECLRSIFAETHYATFEIIVLDNASADSSCSKIEEEFGDKIKLICSKKNHGFAVGNNIAAKHASGKFLLLLNPDTVVLDSAIDRLLDFAGAQEKAGIWGGRTLFADGKLNPASCWGKQTLWSLSSQALGLSSLLRDTSLFNPEGYGAWDRNNDSAVDIVSGCFLLIPKMLWKDLEGFDERFFMYGEEADLCLRARKLGYKPMVTSVATIIHHGGASETIRADKIVRLLAARMQLVDKHFNKVTKHLGLFMLACWPVSRFIAHKALAIFGRQQSVHNAETWLTVLKMYKLWYFRQNFRP